MANNLFIETFEKCPILLNFKAGANFTFMAKKGQKIKKIILVVDDDKDIVQTIKGNLAGFSVISA